jgi:hypothetical protein
MDPNANLAEQRRIIARILDGDSSADWSRLAELADDLDNWLSHGGCLPQAWGRQHLSRD